MSKKKTNSIEINGNRYDIHTGQLLSGTKPLAPRAVDGVSKAQATAVTKPLAVKAKPVTAKAVQAPSMRDVVRQPAQTAAPHRIQQTKTLMRHSVAKPAASLKSRVKVHNGQGALAHHSGQVLAKPSVATINDTRLVRSQQVSKSQAVKKFHTPPATHNQLAAWQPNQQQHTAVGATPALVAQKPSVAPPTGRAKTTADLLQRALDQASAQEATPLPAPKTNMHRQVLGLACAAVVAIGLLGFMALHNVSGIRFQMASAKAGFSASSPGYKAVGFRASTTDATPGSITQHFQSNSDDRQYSITQKNSSWDSQTLLDSFVSKTSSSHQTELVGGRTVYLYGNGSATWVSGGVWYQVQTDGALSDRQIIQLVSSL